MSSNQSAHKKTDGTKNLLALGVALLIIGLVLVALTFFFWGFVKRGAQAVRLLPGHETVQALVTQSSLRRSPAKYEFEFGGQTYRGQAGKEQRGDKIEVAFLENNPSVNRPIDGLAMDIAFAIGVPILLFSIAAFSFWKERNSKKNLKASGSIQKKPLTSIVAPSEHAPPDHASPDHASPDHTPPDHASPDHASPDHASPDHASPSVETHQAIESAKDRGELPEIDEPVWEEQIKINELPAGPLRTSVKRKKPEGRLAREKACPLLSAPLVERSSSQRYCGSF